MKLEHKIIIKLAMQMGYAEASKDAIIPLLRSTNQIAEKLKIASNNSHLNKLFDMTGDSGKSLILDNFSIMYSLRLDAK